MKSKTTKTIRKENLLQDFKQLAKSMQSLTIKAIIEYSREVDIIIKTDSRDASYIEHTLDGILGFCFDENMLKLYKKLCRYYYGIDPNTATDYVYAYRDMWEPI